jgi:hypothetical protein
MKGKDALEGSSATPGGVLRRRPGQSEYGIANSTREDPGSNSANQATDEADVDFSTGQEAS